MFLKVLLELRPGGKLDYRSNNTSSIVSAWMNEYFNINGENVIAVKVYDSHMDGGIVGGQVGIYHDADISYLDYVISGKWKFHTFK